ncbi:hypothetical protein [Streptomyces sp. SID3212]|uniref:hypothetical protein n=1 Tax=Streptomyces sp. SID3212 TaxID=2690259 RepID=UPI00136D17E3|nr:hypothetical protein [Streptomyces sp. SID3212]MYV57204.1 hypothetical protein [Streptomyces sp. SID3212]
MEQGPYNYGRDHEEDESSWWGGNKKNKNQGDAAALYAQLREQFALDIDRQTEILTARTDQATNAVLSALEGLGERVDTVARNVELLLNALRDQGVREAIDTGRATSDLHRDHLPLAETYRTLVTQSLRDLGRLLCPKEEDEGRTELARRRARAVAQLVVLLFHPLDRPMSSAQEEVTARLRELGLATEVPGFRGQFPAVFQRASELREGVAGLALPAALDFETDVTALPADSHQPWEQQADDARPEFLIAPAYVVGGDRPRSLSLPVVFLTPVAHR